jgi:hypothetical protein
MVRGVIKNKCSTIWDSGKIRGHTPLGENKKISIGGADIKYEPEQPFSRVPDPTGNMGLIEPARVMLVNIKDNNCAGAHALDNQP